MLAQGPQSWVSIISSNQLEQQPWTTLWDNNKSFEFLEQDICKSV